MEYDFDVIERLIDIESAPKNVKLDKFGRIVRERSEPRNVRGSRDRRSRSRSDRSRGRGDKRRSSPSRSPRRSRNGSDNDGYDRKMEESKRRRLEEERKRDNDQSRREDCSIMVMGLHPTVGDRDVYEFFSKEAGKVRDLYVVRDSRTGKSKGVAYVEFYLQESIMKALACNGRLINGYGPIRIQASGAEKNRAAIAQRQVTVSQQEKPIVLFIMGLTGPLSFISEAELKSLFAPFGEIEYADIGKCPYTGKGRGFARVMFRKAVDAREAMACLNGFKLAGQAIQVGYLSGSLGEKHERYSFNTTDEEYLRSSTERSRLMDALSRR